MAVLGPRAGTAALLILVLFAGLPFVRPAQAERVLGLTWDRTYLSVVPGTSSVEQTRDGGFIMSALSRGLWVMKANAAGLPEWQREYTDQSGIVTQTRDGGYILVGGNRLLKLDHMGNPEWSKAYDIAGGKNFISARQTRDGGFIALGSWTPPGLDFSRAWLVKFGLVGNVEWQHAYAGSAFVEPYSVRETSDGGFVVAASLPLNNSQRAWIFKTDPIGGMVWQKAYAVPVGNSVIDDHAFSVRQTHDGGYVVGGDVIVWGHSAYLPFQVQLYSYAWVLRLDSQGDIVWQRLFGGGGFTQHAYVSEMSDDGFIVSGRFEPANLGGPLVGLGGPFLLRLDAYGNMVWQKIYGEVNDFLIQAHQTRDGGIIAVGSMVGGSPNCCDNLAWALKVDSNGSIRGCAVGVQSNATLTDTSATVTSTTIASTNTNATGTSTDVAVTTPSILAVQNQCHLQNQQGMDEDKHAIATPPLP